MRAPQARDLRDAAVLGAAFFLIALLSLLFAKEAGRVAAVWPANAVLLVALLKARRGLTWPFAAVAWMANVSANLVTGDQVLTAAVLSGANVAEALLCLFVLSRWVRGDLDLTLPRHLAMFGLAVTLTGPLGSAAAAAFYLHATDHGAFLDLLTIWWPTDTLGLLIFAPALLILADGSARRLLEPGLRRRLVANFAVLALGLALVFGQQSYPLLFIIPPILVLLTFQLGLAGAALGILATAVVSIVALMMGSGPTMLAGPDLVSRVATLQVFLAFTALTTLPLASVLAGQRRLETSLLAARDAAERAAAAAAEANAVAAMAEKMVGLGYWLYRPATREITWSDEAYRVYGLDPAQGVPDFEAVVALYHPDDRPRVRELTFKSLKTGEPYEAELRILDGDDVRPIIAGTRRLYAADGSVSALLGTFMDVSRLRRAEAELVESEARYRQLADAIPDLILRVDPTGVITYASGAARRYGYEPEMLVGRRTSEFVHPDDVAGSAARSDALAEARGVDPTIRREQRVRTADGQWVWLEGKPTQILGKDGRVVEIVNAFRDVTRRRALEDELRAAREVAERAVEAKSDFLSNMSHELRTPLTAIMGFAGLLKGTGKLGPRESLFVERIDTASDALHGLVNDILDYSKIEAGGVVLERAPVDLPRVIEESLAMVSGLAEHKGLAISTEVEAAIPAFVGDRTRLRQVLVNLLSNAVKFTEAGGVTLSVTSMGPQRLRFAVSDTGVGIPPDRVAHVFERFTQADGSTTRTHGGTGLGLAICRGLVEAMDGEIGVESRLGVGSTFAFTIAAPGSATRRRTRSAA